MSLKQCVRSQITRLKLQKSFLTYSMVHHYEYSTITGGDESGPPCVSLNFP